MLVFKDFSETPSTSGQWQLALLLFSEMLSGSIGAPSPDSVSVGSAIAACERTSRWQAALEVLWLSTSQRVALSGIAINSAISSLRDAAHWQSALQLFHFFFGSETPNPLLPDVVSFSSVLSVLENAGQWEYALSLFVDMQRRSVKPNEFVYAAVLRALGSKAFNGIQEDSAVAGLADIQPWLLGLELLKEALTANIPTAPNSIGYVNTAVLAAALNMLEQARRWIESLALLAHVCRKKLRPNMMNYAAAITTCAKSQVWEPALGLFNELCEGRSIPDIVVCSATMSACEKCFRWEYVLQLLEYGWNGSIQLDPEAYQTAMLSFNKAGQWELSMWLLGTIRFLPASQLASKPGEGRTLPRLSTDFRSVLAAAVCACTQARNWPQALVLLDEMTERSSPSSMPRESPEANLKHRQPEVDYVKEARSTAMLACAEAGAWQQCQHLLEELGSNSDLMAFGLMARAYGNSRNWQSALGLLRRMQERSLIDDQGSVWNVVAWACQASAAQLPGEPMSLRTRQANLAFF